MYFHSRYAFSPFIIRLNCWFINMWRFSLSEKFRFGPYSLKLCERKTKIIRQQWWVQFLCIQQWCLDWVASPTRRVSSGFERRQYQPFTAVSFHFWNIQFQLKLRKHAGSKRLTLIRLLSSKDRLSFSLNNYFSRLLKTEWLLMADRQKSITIWSMTSILSLWTWDRNCKAAELSSEATGWCFDSRSDMWIKMVMFRSGSKQQNSEEMSEGEQSLE